MEIERAALAGALAPMGAATMLPGAAYTSAEVLTWELRHLFAGSWTCLGREQDLCEGPDRVTQRAVSVGAVGVLLTWSATNGDRDRLRAFANTCRHRAHELLAG